MKNLLYIISLCGLLTACDLQEEPYGFYSDDNFYKSETDAESGLLYAYNALTFLEYSRGIFYIGDIPTETMSPKSDEAGDVYQLENWIANRETEQLRYWCQDAVSGASNYQINIQYEYSSPQTTSYWFTHGNNTLWMQWTTGGGRVQTYVYDRIYSAPW